MFPCITVTDLYKRHVSSTLLVQRRKHWVPQVRNKILLTAAENKFSLSVISVELFIVQFLNIYSFKNAVWYWRQLKITFLINNTKHIRNRIRVIKDATIIHLNCVQSVLDFNLFNIGAYIIKGFNNGIETYIYFKLVGSG